MVNISLIHLLTTTHQGNGRSHLTKKLQDLHRACIVPVYHLFLFFTPHNEVLFFFFFYYILNSTVYQFETKNFFALEMFLNTFPIYSSNNDLPSWEFSCSVFLPSSYIVTIFNIEKWLFSINISNNMHFIVASSKHKTSHYNLYLPFTHIAQLHY
jgi:hypothetical protein